MLLWLLLLYIHEKMSTYALAAASAGLWLNLGWLHKLRCVVCCKRCDVPDLRFCGG